MQVNLLRCQSVDSQEGLTEKTASTCFPKPLRPSQSHCKSMGPRSWGWETQPRWVICGTSDRGGQIYYECLNVSQTFLWLLMDNVWRGWFWNLNLKVWGRISFSDQVFTVMYFSSIHHYSPSGDEWHLWIVPIEVDNVIGLALHTPFITHTLAWTNSYCSFCLSYHVAVVQ